MSIQNGQLYSELGSLFKHIKNKTKTPAFPEGCRGHLPLDHHHLGTHTTCKRHWKEATPRRTHLRSQVLPRPRGYLQSAREAGTAGARAPQSPTVPALRPSLQADRVKSGPAARSGRLPPLLLQSRDPAQCHHCPCLTTGPFAPNPQQTCDFCGSPEYFLWSRMSGTH